ncbi:uncharacterized protein LOC105849643 [Hydra vulgaris]|uniref:Uncharacterized protein LOC105849643 n=1 Tax=Hydra vulgaris TaxID=6087 RepID=A0ABM4CT02_HYDVU
MNFVTIATILISLAPQINGHGYLQNPPARNSMWRFGFNTPANYNDNELFCGGATVMNMNNGGRCGVCGDPWHEKDQPHMDGGSYDKGIIVKTYKKGQIIDLEILLTTSHMGYFEIRVGDFSKTKTSGDSIGKLNGELLELVKGGTKFAVTEWGRFLYKYQVRLPSNLKCERCVLQWWYKGGNNWGCEGGKCGMGLGPQEHFVNCADIKIVA